MLPYTVYFSQTKVGSNGGVNTATLGYSFRSRRLQNKEYE